MISIKLFYWSLIFRNSLQNVSMDLFLITFLLDEVIIALFCKIFLDEKQRAVLLRT